VEEIKVRMGEDYMCYSSIAGLVKKASEAPDLLGGTKKAAEMCRGLVEIGDGRILSGGLQLAISTKRIVCTSFDRDWKCLRCGTHGQEPAFKIRGVANSNSPRQAVILADQTFPAYLPAEGQAKCLKIILLENGSTPDLIDEFFQTAWQQEGAPWLRNPDLFCFSPGQCGDIAVHLGPGGSQADTG
jgi:hypothetical protein